MNEESIDRKEFLKMADEGKVRTEEQELEKLEEIVASIYHNLGDMIELETQLKLLEVGIDAHLKQLSSEILKKKKGGQK